MEGEGGLDSVGGEGEDGEQAVSFAPTLDEQPIMAADDLRRDLVVPHQGLTHGFGRSLPEVGAALDVGKEEREGAGGQGHGSGLCAMEWTAGLLYTKPQ